GILAHAEAGPVVEHCDAERNLSKGALELQPPGDLSVTDRHIENDRQNLLLEEARIVLKRQEDRAKDLLPRQPFLQVFREDLTGNRLSHSGRLQFGNDGAQRTEEVRVPPEPFQSVGRRQRCLLASDPYPQDTTLLDDPGAPSPCLHHEPVDLEQPLERSRPPSLREVAGDLLPQTSDAVAAACVREVR